MKRRVPPLALFGCLCALLGAVSPAQAALQPTALQLDGVDFSMPRAQVVSLGVNKFMEVYSARTKNLSTQGQIAGYRYFLKCQRADNDAKAQGLGAARRQQIASVRGALDDLGAASWEMCFIRSGGGTMWSQIGASASATREEFLGKLIKSLPISPRRSQTARSQARGLMRRARHELNLVGKQKASLDGYGDLTVARTRSEYGRSWLQADTAFKRLQRLLVLLPDRSARQVANRAFDEIHNAAQESNQEDSL